MFEIPKLFEEDVLELHSSARVILYSPISVASFFHRQIPSKVSQNGLSVALASPSPVHVSRIFFDGRYTRTSVLSRKFI